MTIAEPTTTLTDYLLAVLAASLGWRLWHLEGADRRRRLWARAFVCLAVAAAAGGTAHGFVEALSATASAFVWRLTLVAVGATGAAVLLAGLAARLEPRRLTPWSGVLGLEVALYSYWVWFVDSDFRYAVLQYGVAMLVTLLIHVSPRVWRQPGSRAIVAGIVVSFVAAAIQRAGIAPHAAFNHNDLYHVVQMAGVILLYRGAAAVPDDRAADAS